MGTKLKVAGWLSIGALAGAMTTMQFQAIARSSVSQLPLEELQQLAAVFGMVKSDYVEPVDEKKLINDAISGMVSGLDPHSQFFDKKSFKEFREGTSGRFVGVGIEIGMEEGLVKVVTPIEGSPAFRAGLKSGDLITKIDDTAVKGLTMDQAVKRMRGEAGSKVVLNIFRKSENRVFPVTITREEIKVQSITAKMLEPGYGWIRIRQFQERTVEDFSRKVDDLYRESGCYSYGSGWNRAALLAFVLGVLPNLPGFLNAALPARFGDVAEPFKLIYTYAWFVGMAIAAVVYRVAMGARATPVPANA